MTKIFSFTILESCPWYFVKCKEYISKVHDLILMKNAYFWLSLRKTFQRTVAVQWKETLSFAGKTKRRSQCPPLGLKARRVPSKFTDTTVEYERGGVALLGLWWVAQEALLGCCPKKHFRSKAAALPAYQATVPGFEGGLQTSGRSRLILLSTAAMGIW